MLIYLIILIAPLLVFGQEDNPFADVKPKELSESQVKKQWAEQLSGENFGYRKEIMLETGINNKGETAGRHSVGFEVLKKFSSDVKTYGALNLQGRLVRRDGFIGFPNDMEGIDREGWFTEYHNAYFDFYNVADPLLSEEGKSKNIGKFNARMGRFYVPFGLNLATDTHGTLLQLSNNENFGFERDWYTGFWGNINNDLRYDVFYLAGSGYDLKYQGQNGLTAARLSLGNIYLNEYGLEGGISGISGERLLPHRTVVKTSRGGIDGRYRAIVPKGLFTWTSELSSGKDNDESVLTQLHQADYLYFSRNWGAATQYRWFKNQRSALLAEVTWYFRNDVAGSNLHWIKLNYQRDIEQSIGDKNDVWTTQYYYYF